MSDDFGPAPILDFDGTIANLAVDWLALRSKLGVEQIDHLWDGDSNAWDLVRDAEEQAAMLAAARAPVVERLERVACFAVLTSNSERAIEQFFLRYRALKGKARLVVGRETLAGPKSTFGVFSRGFELCIAATADVRAGRPIVYVGDMSYERDFARRLGAVAIDAAHVGAEHARRQEPGGNAS